MAFNSKLGLLCLIIAIGLLFFIDMRVLLVLGFFYYAYKLLYKNEGAKRIDKLVIAALIALFILEMIMTYLSATGYISIADQSAQSLV